MTNCLYHILVMSSDTSLSLPTGIKTSNLYFSSPKKSSTHDLVSHIDSVSKVLLIPDKS